MIQGMSDLEPFAEMLRSTENGHSPAQYRIGYRLSTTHALLAHVEIPAETVQRAVLSKLLIAPRITPDGTVTADISVQNDFASEPRIEVAATPIDQLVIRGTGAENLRVEEAQVTELHALLGLLERSVSAVRAALATYAGTI